MQKKGKLIVFYGINNLGKSTQAQVLVEWLIAQGIEAEYLKFAIYDLVPSGPLLNAYLRAGNPNGLSPREFQLLQVLNRTQYQPILEAALESGKWIIAEDYVGTGIARGMGSGLDQKFLEELNQHLPKPDLEFFFDGERFVSGIEKDHQHEQNDLLMQKVRFAHQQLANQYQWMPINANASIDQVQQELRRFVKERFL